MCGICGKVDFTGAPVAEVLIERMCRTLVHRGPDAQGIHVAAGIGLGQRRLSVIDLDARGVAPLANEDGSIWVTFNGEIYNFRELRARARGARPRFRTRHATPRCSSTSTRSTASTASQHLRGMFAFAIWDEPAAAAAPRPRPAGQEAALLRAHGRRASSSAPRSSAVSRTRRSSATPDYRGDRRVPDLPVRPEPAARHSPGISQAAARRTMLVCDAAGRCELERYWRPPIRPRRSARPRGGAARRVMRTAARGGPDAAGHRRADRRVPERRHRLELGRRADGAQSAPSRVKTFSIGFEDAAFNELPYARMVAERYDTEHHEFVVRADAAEVLPQLVALTASRSRIPRRSRRIYVSKMARADVTVALSGDGGDETFRRLRELPRGERSGIATMPCRIRSARALAQGATAGHSIGFPSTARLLAPRAVRDAGPGRCRSGSGYRPRFQAEEKQVAYTPRVPRPACRRATLGAARGRPRVGTRRWTPSTG